MNLEAHHLTRTTSLDRGDETLTTVAGARGFVDHIGPYFKRRRFSPASAGHVGGGMHAEHMDIYKVVFLGEMKTL